MFAALFLSGPVWAGPTAQPDPYEARRSQCVAWMMSAYPSGLEELACTSEFDLPSPFLFKCIRAQRVGFASETQIAACRLMFERAAEETAAGYVLR